MENNSLFKTRQLSKYRAWAGNKKGCLFYVPAKKAICLINAPWRQDDIVGRYDDLHECEIKEISQEDIVLQGFSAVLLSKGSHADDSDDSVRELWEVCKQSGFYGLDIIPAYDIMAFLIRESLYWSKRNREILVHHFGRETIYMLDQRISILFREELAKILTKSEDVLFRTHSIFKVKLNDKNVACTYHDFCISALNPRMEKEDNLVCGFPAVYINYRMVRNAIEQILTGSIAMDSIADMILNNFSEYCPASNAYTSFPQLYVSDIKNIPSADEINFDSPIENCDMMYQTYIQLFINRHQREVVYIKFFTNQLKYCLFQDNIDKIFDKEQKADIMLHSEQFLLYALKHLEGREAYPHALKLLEKSFPPLAETINNEFSKEEDDLPKKRDYVALVKWLEYQKSIGNDYYKEAGFNRSEMCRRLSSILHWEVKENSLRKAQENKN